MNKLNCLQGLLRIRAALGWFSTLSRGGAKWKGKVSEQAHLKCYVMRPEKVMFVSIPMELKTNFFSSFFKKYFWKNSIGQ